MEQKTSTPSTNSEDLLSQFSSDDEDWDTDLEDRCEMGPPNSAHQLKQVYLTTCAQMGIPPVSSFIKQMTSTKVTDFITQSTM